jgi:hypothetical protein
MEHKHVYMMPTHRDPTDLRNLESRCCSHFVARAQFLPNSQNPVDPDLTELWYKCLWCDYCEMQPPPLYLLMLKVEGCTILPTEWSITEYLARHFDIPNAAVREWQVKHF